jgi:hypothetical protein
MEEYRCYLLDARGRFQEVREFRAPGLSQATGEARTALLASPCRYFELWQQAQMLLREAREIDRSVHTIDVAAK